MTERYQKDVGESSKLLPLFLAPNHRLGGNWMPVGG
jgi:hypothetical protein